MTSTVSNNSLVLQRCAVCKIDLKGRFVYLDEEFAELTGYLDKELLGKPISQILAVSSKDLISKLLNDRNHYETFYDASRLTLLKKDNTPIDGVAVMSLNFIGGNPVNFQIIISKDSQSERIAVTTVRSDLHLEFLRDLANTVNAGDWEGHLKSLLAYCGAGQAAVYRVGEDNLDQIAHAVDENNAAFAQMEIGKTTELHIRTAESGTDYSFTDKESVQRAIEYVNQAPNEYLTSFRFAGDGPYLLRLIFDDGLESSDAVSAIERAKLGIKITINVFGRAAHELILSAKAGDPSNAKPANDISLFWLDLVNTIETSAEVITGKAEELGHEFYNKLGREGNEILNDIARNTNGLASRLSELKHVLGLLRKSDEKELTDLNLVLNQVLKGIVEEYPKLQLNCSYDSLPKIMVDRLKVLALLRYLFKGSIRINDFQKTRFKVKGKSQDNNCVLSVLVYNLNLTSKKISEILDFDYLPPDGRKSSSITEKTTGLAVAQLMAKHLGGGITAEQVEGKGTSFQLFIPSE